jgi:cysteinyl-tRNA synthetase
VKLVSPTELMRIRDEKKAILDAKAAQKAANQEKERQKRLLELEKGRLAPEDMFKPPAVAEGTYGSWDASGIPLTDGEGKELSKNQAKSVRKNWEQQKQRHEKYLAAQNP